MKIQSHVVGLIFLCQAYVACSFAREQGSWTIPAAGNGFVARGQQGAVPGSGGDFLKLTDAGGVLSIYFHVDRPAHIEIRLAATSGAGPVSLRARMGSVTKRVTVPGNGPTCVGIGGLDVKEAGYVCVELHKEPAANDAAEVEIRGLSLRSGTHGLRITCVATDEGNMFYWGRRGPSVHLAYEVPRDTAVEYAYGEITVAEGDDPPGSYFMANGFGEGYFGIQVNGPTERRVLFSVWSPFPTDDPRTIPEDQRVELLAKGPQVRAGEFGDEGSGGQSYLVYPWQAGRTYRFLTRVVPDGKGSTVYTSWFGAEHEKEWRLIASFRRPRTDTYLKGFHSFLENFDPGTGNHPRRGQHGNIWVRDAEGGWRECLRARFSVDATGQGGHRLDFDGGATDSMFYLRNCGFFTGTTKPGDAFERTSAAAGPPEIDLANLPLE